MKISQGHISQSVADFPWLENFQLQPYHDKTAPAIFFGCYSYQDVETICAHTGLKVIYWCGQDAIDCIFYGWHLWLTNCHHITLNKSISLALQSFLPIKLVKPYTFKSELWNPTPLGFSIYAYCPDSHPAYHNADIIKQLEMELPQFNFIIGTGEISQQEWMSGHGNSIYDKCFIGLVLNNFAGGAATIIQLGLKGRPVITNAIEGLPHTLPWRSIKQIKKLILTAHSTKAEVSRLAVLQSLDESNHFLNLSNYEQP